MTLVKRCRVCGRNPLPRPDIDRAVYQAVLDRYGLEAEVEKLDEEVGELAAALLGHALNTPYEHSLEALEEVIKEAGDVLNVIRAIDLALGGLIEQAARSKMLRQQCRMLPTKEES